ncbi:hypothetical protein CHELA40_13198 [Chelatococcus asaccharovorans]|nr:hypothetical protein CHELA40_13198 [Chelatococcus asaccharovorans]CAH1679703.1 hypothetical protein CHELA17_62422 [Chelatococcus asaccharovorans]
MEEPLPDLRAADLGGRRVFHEVVERHRATAAQPRLDVLHADTDVLAQARLGAHAFVHLEHVITRDGDVLTQLVELVRPGHQAIEHLHRHRHEVRMRHPCAVVTVAGLALLVGAHLGEGGLVGGRIVLHRDLRRHAAHGEGAAAVAGLDQEQRIGAQEGLAHHHRAAIRREEVGVLAQTLDEGKDVVPAAAVEAGHMVAQLVDDLVHLEGRRQRLDQHRRLERALGDAQHLFRMGEDIVPEPRLHMALHLREIESRCRALRNDVLGIVEDIEAEIEQRAGYRRAVDRHMLLQEMPAARTDDQRRRLVRELVRLAGGRIGEIDAALPAVPQIDLALDHIGPGRRGCILEIRHEHLRPAVERVDDHLAIDRTGDLDPAIEEVARDGRDLPVTLADVPGLGQEVGRLPGVKGLLPLRSQREEAATRCIKAAMQIGQETQGGWSEYLIAACDRSTGNDDTGRRFMIGHAHSPLTAGECRPIRL